MPLPKNISGQEVIKILCNKFGFQISGRSGSHVRLHKITPDGKVGTVVPVHPAVAGGTLRSALKLAKISEEEFLKYV